MEPLWTAATDQTSSSISSEDTTPALLPPNGWSTNFVDPPTIAPAIVAGLTVCLAISTVSVALRVSAQWYLFKKLIWVDFWSLIAWISHIAFAACLYACVPYGAGRHQWDVSLTSYYNIQYLLFIDFVIYDIAVAAAKIAILLQLKAIFAGNGQHNRFFWAIVALVFINISFYLALSFALIFQCHPVAKGWDPSIPGLCLNQDSLLASSGPFNIVSDFLIFALPIWAIAQLHLPIKKRIEVCCAFAVGLFGCICSAVRLVYSVRLDLSGDGTMLIFENQLWANAEICAGILIANAMIVPRFWRDLRGKGDSSFSYSSAPGARNSNRHARRSQRISRGTGAVVCPGSPRSTLVQGGEESWIELKDSDASSRGQTTLASGPSGVGADGRKGSEGSREGSQPGSFEEPTYGGIMKTIEIETRSEAVSPRERVTFQEPRTMGLTS